MPDGPGHAQRRALVARQAPPHCARNSHASVFEDADRERQRILNLEYGMVTTQPAHLSTDDADYAEGKIVTSVTSADYLAHLPMVTEQ